MSQLAEVVQRQSVTCTVFVGMLVGIAGIVASRPARKALVLGGSLWETCGDL